jgi:hypothetical protein
MTTLSDSCPHEATALLLKVDSARGVLLLLEPGSDQVRIRITCGQEIAGKLEESIRAHDVSESLDIVVRQKHNPVLIKTSGRVSKGEREILSQVALYLSATRESISPN